MKYTAINELDYFQFHDVELKEIKFIDNKMIWMVSSINVMTTNTQNYFAKDMCAEDAVITFENILINNIVFSAWKSYDSNNNLINSVDAITAKPEEYNEILKKSLESYCYMQGMEETKRMDDGTYKSCFSIDGGAGMFYFTFSFSKSTVEWDEYSGEAWYEHPKWKKK